MAKKRTVLLPRSRRILERTGDQIKLARLRRKLSAEQVSERADISRPTLVKIEKGDPSVGIGSYFMVLFVLGLEEDFLLLAKDDDLGRKLQDIGLKVGKRAPKRTGWQ